MKWEKKWREGSYVCGFGFWKKCTFLGFVSFSLFVFSLKNFKENNFPFFPYKLLFLTSKVCIQMVSKVKVCFCLIKKYGGTLFIFLLILLYSERLFSIFFYVYCVGQISFKDTVLYHKPQNMLILFCCFVCVFSILFILFCFPLKRFVYFCCIRSNSMFSYYLSVFLKFIFFVFRPPFVLLLYKLQNSLGTFCLTSIPWLQLHLDKQSKDFEHR